MAFEFGMFHEFQCPAGMSQPEAFAESFEQVEAAERWGLDAMWLAEIHVAPERSVCAAPLTHRQRHRGAHQTHEDRHRRPGIAALPSAAPRRRGRHGRSDQPRKADLRRRAQRLPAHLRSLWRALRRKPRALRRDPRDPEEGVDRGPVLLFGQVLLVPKRQGDAQALPKTLARDPHRRQQSRHVSGDRQARPWRVRRGSPRHAFRARARTSRPTAKAGRRPGIRARARFSCGRRSMSPRRRRRPASEPEESIMYFYRYLGERLEDSATRAGVRAIEDRAARGRRLQTITYDEALRDKIIVGTPEQVDRPADGIEGRARPRRHPGGDELRHQDPASARDEVTAAALRESKAAVSLTTRRLTPALASLRRGMGVKPQPAGWG